MMDGSLSKRGRSALLCFVCCFVCLLSLVVLFLFFFYISNRFMADLETLFVFEGTFFVRVPHLKKRFFCVAGNPVRPCTTQ